MENGTVYWKRNLLVIWISQFLGLGGFACAMPFIPMLLRDNLGITDDAVRGVFVSAYYFCGMSSFTVATVVWGMLADRLGYKIMLLRASYSAALFFPLLAFAPNVWVLLGIRLVTSFFSGTYNAAQTLIATTTPPEKQGFALGLLSSALWSGHMVGFFCGGLIVHYFSYTAAFITCGMLYFTGALLVHVFVKDGFSASKTTVAASGKTQKRPAVRIFTPVVLWILGLFLVMGVARRIDEPFLAMMVEAVNGKINEAFFTGLVSAVAALGGLLSGVVIGHFSDRVSPFKLLPPLLVICMITMLLQAVSTNIYFFMMMRFISFFASGGLYPVLLLVMSRNSDANLKGTFFGLSSSINSAGGVLCTLLSGVIVYFLNVRGIEVAAGILFMLMIPMSMVTFSVIRRSNLKG